jgi:AraC family transcriptional activator of pobA
MANIPVRHINSAGKEPRFSESFSIRDVHDLLGEGDMVQELHRHDFFYVLALEKGKGKHEIDFTTHHVGDRCIFLMRPGQVHQLTLRAGSTGFLMAFKADFYYTNGALSKNLLRKATNKCLYQANDRKFRRLSSILSYIFHEYTHKQERYQEVIKANLDIFFIELSRSRQNNNRQSARGNSYMQERFDEFLELLETNIYKHKQVSEYADMLNLSGYQLNAITKALVGKTCSGVINEQIVLESKRRLLATTGQVSQIACQLGYEDVSYFIRFFRKHTGYSPEAFRHNFK